MPVGPEFHTGQAWFHRGLELLVQALGDYSSNRNNFDALTHALKELTPMAGMFPGPHRGTVRALALTRALQSLCDTLSLIPEDLRKQPGRPDLDGLHESLSSIETDLGSYFRQLTAAKITGVYVIVDPALLGSKNPLVFAEQVLLGGASAIQLREKSHNRKNLLSLSKQLVSLCNRHNALCIINDHVDVAMAAEAHGVHLGQNDMPLPDARSLLKPWQLIGTSNALLDESVRSNLIGADYLAIGAIFPSQSKNDTRPAGLETLQQVRNKVSKEGPPLVAIGGITSENVTEVAQSGADAICVIGAVTSVTDPTSEVKTLLSKFREGHENYKESQLIP